MKSVAKSFSERNSLTVNEKFRNINRVYNMVLLSKAGSLCELKKVVLFLKFNFCLGLMVYRPAKTTGPHYLKNKGK